MNTIPSDTVPSGSTHLHDELLTWEGVVDVVRLPIATCSSWEPDRMASDSGGPALGKPRPVAIHRTRSGITVKRIGLGSEGLTDRRMANIEKRPDGVWRAR